MKCSNITKGRVWPASFLQIFRWQTCRRSRTFSLTFFQANRWMSSRRSISKKAGQKANQIVNSFADLQREGTKIFNDLLEIVAVEIPISSYSLIISIFVRGKPPLPDSLASHCPLGFHDWFQIAFCKKCWIKSSAAPLLRVDGMITFAPSKNLEHKKNFGSKASSDYFASSFPSLEVGHYDWKLDFLRGFPNTRIVV